MYQRVHACAKNAAISAFTLCLGCEWSLHTTYYEPAVALRETHDGMLA